MVTDTYFSKRELESYIHHDVICDFYRDQNIEIVLNIFSNFDDVPLEVAKKLHEVSASPHDWNNLSDEKKKKKMSSCKKILNNDVISRMTYAQYSEVDPNKEIEEFLRRLTLLI